MLLITSYCNPYLQVISLHKTKLLWSCVRRKLLQYKIRGTKNVFSKTWNYHWLNLVIVVLHPYSTWPNKSFLNGILFLIDAQIVLLSDVSFDSSIEFCFDVHLFFFIIFNFTMKILYFRHKLGRGSESNAFIFSLKSRSRYQEPLIK